MAVWLGGAAAAWRRRPAPAAWHGEMIINQSTVWRHRPHSGGAHAGLAGSNGGASCSDDDVLLLLVVLCVLMAY